jgi:uncharacterized protein YlxP (DUF503 family)
MHVGILQIELMLSDGNSLKDKRQVLKRLKDRVGNNFNASIAEVGHMDKWRRSILGIAVISNNKKSLTAHLDHIVEFIMGDRRVTILDHSMEII